MSTRFLHLLPYLQKVNPQWPWMSDKDWYMDCAVLHATLLFVSSGLLLIAALSILHICGVI